ncbi:MAG: hypothetical protein ACYDC8_03075 [Gammaproteobacteria bacterium]
MLPVAEGGFSRIKCAVDHIEEFDILNKSGAVLRQGIRVRYQFITDHHSRRMTCSRAWAAGGNGYDNACVGSFFSNLKNELIFHREFHERDEATPAIFNHIEVFCSLQRSLNISITALRYDTRRRPVLLNRVSVESGVLHKDLS